MKNFWKELNKPIFVLAPMADVTDYPFRQIINKYGKPDVLWTEFVSADGLAHPVAREKLLIDLKFDPNEHPIVAQIFGSNTENIKSASALCMELGFDGIDINMGCPDKSIEKQGAGSGMIKNIESAKAVIAAAKEGAPGIPISVKTRIGYNKNEIDTWIRELLKQDIALLTVHLRTRKEMSLVPAHWELMNDIVKLRDEVAPNTLILGNGDATDLIDANSKFLETGCDGVMLGRAIFGNPFLFAKQKRPEQGEGHVVDLPQKLKVMLEHTKLFEEVLGSHKNFAIMKKHYKAYVNNFEGAKELRVKLMDARDYKEIENITNDFLSKIG
ncbi:MAG: tRNA-dihydrouridine synthase [Candidatus Paceibacterota bacterium]